MVEGSLSSGDSVDLEDGSHREDVTSARHQTLPRPIDLSLETFVPNGVQVTIRHGLNHFAPDAVGTREVLEGITLGFGWQRQRQARLDAPADRRQRGSSTHI